MLKIEKLSLAQVNGANAKEVSSKKNPNVTAPMIKTASSLSSMAAINKSFVSFKGDYYKTLNENYFKLPEGAAPDVFQKASAANLFKGNDVVVTAPTGTGKTAIAHYVITKNLDEGKKTFYTTPLKALSNEKFRSFKKTYGEDNVGLLTGDTKVNADAPIVVMTTEVYRNMVFADKFKDHNDNLDNLKTVIFDELHYLGDVDRGGIWEQSIILSDPKTQLLSLSATVGNNEKVGNWMASVKDHPKLEVASSKTQDLETYKAKETMPLHTVLVDVPSENRHVPLKFENFGVAPAVPGNGKSKIKLKNNNKKAKGSESDLQRASANPDIRSYRTMVKKLQEKDQLPAIFFIFSKKGSKTVLNFLSNHGTKLTTDDEEKQIEDTLKRYKDEGKYLGESLDTDALKNGYAIHNSGLLPSQKELVEELFQKKLVKVCIATETLSAGINMPARTTVISAVRKPSSTPDAADGRRYLSPNEFHQMAGRAGRRGIDTEGFCYTLSCNRVQEGKFQQLVKSPANNIDSSFKPDFSFIASYYDTCKNDDVIKEIFSKSLYAYDENPQKSKQNSKDLLEVFGAKRKVLRNFDFIKSDHELTAKGKLLAKLNGYEQIPIIETIASKKLGGMNPVELAGAVGSLANISNKPELKDKEGMKKDNEPEVFEHENEMLTWFVEGLDKTVGTYNKNMEDTPNFATVKQNKDAAKHVYEWAALNNSNTEAKENWSYLYNGPMHDSIKDEGSVFKEVTMTIDLLKQMKDIADVGKNISEKESDIEYYTQLRENIDESINLLFKEPIANV